MCLTKVALWQKLVNITVVGYRIVLLWRGVATARIQNYIMDLLAKYMTEILKIARCIIHTEQTLSKKRRWYLVT